MNTRTRRQKTPPASESHKTHNAQSSATSNPTPLPDTDSSPNTAAPVSTIRILKKATCQKLSPRASGELTYHLGYREADQHVFLRITANQSSGYFSQEWIALEAIEAKLAEQHDQSFKAIVFTLLFERRGANNHGFLGAVLKAEGIVEADEQQPLLLYAIEDRSPFSQQIEQLRNDGMDLHEDVAEEHARKEARKQARLAEQARRREAHKQQAKVEDTDAQAATSEAEMDTAAAPEAMKETSSDVAPEADMDASSADPAPSEPSTKASPKP